MDCAFVFLSRGGIPFSEVDKMSETQLKKSLLGFEPSIVHKIFTDAIIHEENTSQNASSKNEFQNQK
jgi:hypothetical protein